MRSNSEVVVEEGDGGQEEDREKIDRSALLSK